MRRIIRQRIRQKSQGMDLSVDFNAEIVVNRGDSRAAEEDSPEPPAAPEARAPEDANDDPGRAA
jgi:hypothetical protein